MSICVICKEDIPDARLDVQLRTITCSRKCSKEHRAALNRESSRRARERARNEQLRAMEGLGR